MRVRPALQKIGRRFGANVKVVEVPPGPPVLAPIVAEIYGPEAQGRRQVAKAVRAVFDKTAGVVDVDDSSIAAAPKTLLLVDRRKAAMLGVPQHAIVGTLRAGLAGEAASYLHDETKYPAAATLQLPAEQQGGLDTLLQLGVRARRGEARPDPRTGHGQRHAARAADLPQGSAAGELTSSPTWPVASTARCTACSRMRSGVAAIVTPGGGALAEYFIRQPDDPYRDYAIKWDGEWQITYETFRDMGAAYAVGLVLIYLLVVAQFGSYLTPLIIMAPIPLTIIGVMPGHALLGAQYTATSMIGMIALAGIIVRNSILLVDFINLQVRARRGLQGSGRALGDHSRAADHADRPGRDARRVLHPRRSDLQRARDLADLRHLRVHPADAGGHSRPVLRGLPQSRSAPPRIHSKENSHDLLATRPTRSPAPSSCCRWPWAFRVARYSSANGGWRSPHSSAPICCKARSPAGASWKPSCASSVRGKAVDSDRMHLVCPSCGGNNRVPDAPE